MEDFLNKFGAVLAAIISAMGGWYIYDRNVTNSRIAKVEEDLVKNKIDIKVIETRFEELKADTEEIKSSQKDILDLLTKRRR